MALFDLIVHRRASDPVDYRQVVAQCPAVQLIEVDRASSVHAARTSLVSIGTAPYVGWFDPDDTLYEFTLPRLVQTIRNNPNSIGALTYSHYQSPNGKKRSISIRGLHDRPIDCHLMRVFKRDWLESNVKLFNHPIPEWPVIAKALEDGAIILPFEGYCWNASLTGTHKTITPDEVRATRRVVQTILGDKYRKIMNGQQPWLQPSL